MKERRTIWAPAFDRRSDDPKKDYGIHGMEIKFLLIEDHKAVQFVIYTSWMLPHVTKEHEQRGYHPSPMGADLGYHSPHPQYEDHTITKNCEWTDGDCYYDGSSLRAQELFEKFIAEGEEYMWQQLEEEWDYHFKEKGNEPTMEQA